MEFVESKRQLRKKEHLFVVDFTNGVNHRHGSLEYDLETSYFKVYWGGKFSMQFDEDVNFDSISGSKDETSKCSFSVKIKTEYQIACKSVVFVDTSNRHSIDSFLFIFSAQRDRIVQ